jgi:hypothetical protein
MCGRLVVVLWRCRTSCNDDDGGVQPALLNRDCDDDETIKTAMTKGEAAIDLNDDIDHAPRITTIVDIAARRRASVFWMDDCIVGR